MTKCASLKSVAAPKGLVGGPFGSSLVGSDYVSQGVPVIRGSNMQSPWIGGDFAYVTREKFDRDLSRNTAEPGDLVFTQRGTLGQVAMVPDSGQSIFVVSQSQMRLRVDADVADARFVYYACSAPSFLKQVSDHAIATGVPHINLGILGQLTIPTLQLTEQRGIAEVLGALDDKIAANSQLAATADALIRARYEQRASRADSPRPLGEIAATSRDQADPASVEPETAYVGLEHLPRRSMWLPEHGRAGDVTSGKFAFQPADTLFGKLRPYFHKVVMAAGYGICSTDILVVRPRDEGLAGLVLAACASDEAIALASAASEGTRMPRTSWKDLSTLAVPWLGSAEAADFSRDVLRLAESVGARLAESQMLAVTRDALLPLLMSGKVRVKDAEKAVKGVV